MVPAAGGAPVTRTVASGRGDTLIGLVASPTEATVLLDYVEPGSNSLGGLRAAYGPLSGGRWSAPQTIDAGWRVGYVNGMPRAQAQLSLAPDGSVLVAWDGCRSPRACGGVIGPGGGYAQQRVVVAWQRPGRPFAPAAAVRAAPLGAVPQFDAAGAAYLSSSCSGTVAIEPPRSRSFRAATVTAGPVQSFALALSGAGRGLAAWVAGTCSYNDASGNQDGAVRVSVLRDGAFAAPFTVDPAPTESVESVAAGGAVDVSWSDRTSATVQVAADGTLGAVARNATALPLAVDGDGDVLLAPAVALGFGDFVRPAGGGVDQPGPAPWGVGTWAVSSAANVMALLWTPDIATLELSIWRGRLSSAV